MQINFEPFLDTSTATRPQNSCGSTRKPFRPWRAAAQCPRTASATSGATAPPSWTSGKKRATFEDATRAVMNEMTISFFTRTRFQAGSLKRIRRERRNEDVWEFRYYETDATGARRRRAVTVGSVRDYPSEAAARRSGMVQSILLRVNSEQPLAAAEPISFGALVARYEQEEMPERHSTRTSYQSNLDGTFARAGRTHRYT